MKPPTSIRRILPATALLLAAGCGPSVPAASPAAQPGAPRPAAQQVVRDGVRMWYRVAGNGRSGAPPVVFLHGGPGQGSAHFEVLAGPHVEPRVRTVYFDQRGSGRSDRPAGNDYAIATLVEDVEALRAALGVPRIVPMGHSFGGLLALEYAARYPERTAGVVFVAGVWDVPLQCRLRMRTLQQLRPEAYERARADTLAPDGTRRSGCSVEGRGFRSGQEREAYNVQAMYRDPTMAARLDSVGAAHGTRNTGEMGRALFGSGELMSYRLGDPARVAVPVLVVAGRHDGAARPEGLRELARVLPNARYLEYEGSGHFVYLDEPERFARDLARLVSSLTPR